MANKEYICQNCGEYAFKCNCPTPELVKPDFLERKKDV